MFYWGRQNWARRGSPICTPIKRDCGLGSWPTYIAQQGMGGGFYVMFHQLINPRKVLRAMVKFGKITNAILWRVTEFAHDC